MYLFHFEYKDVVIYDLHRYLTKLYTINKAMGEEV